ncbi:S8 family serine peptidase [Streptomyces sp. JH14]|uniref:S8 family serine peptidase n=1 Tax=Streptomyces sp. JH14 TaxID=2793630 RepID=UPI0023F86E55|nr:S8 family serine peptidase [Streptomyces sp. JH14]MDF6042667.1 S8 family serine peptidase [Streptomyces sp. JH14]
MPKVPIPRSGPITLVVVAALALGVMPATAAISADLASPVQPTAAHQAPGGISTHTVTLITGDKVTIGTAADGTAVRSFEGVNGTTTGFHRAVIDGSTYVYPDAVLPYVTTGKLDKQLFNVTRLIADGYDDAHTSRLPLIVRYTAAAARSRTQPKVAGSTIVRRLDSIQGAAVAQNRKQAPAFWSALTGGSGSAARSAHPAFAGGVAKVWLDGKVKADLADSTAQIGAQKVWAEGDTGKDVKVAVLDTGVDTEHPDLAGQVDATASFIPEEPEITDYHGHGTHTASTIAGTGSASDGKERGVSFGARLEIGKVLNGRGSGQESWIIAGMEWAARDQQAKIVSMSLGGGGDATDPMSQAVDELSRETGALFVIAAGNGGPQSIGSPGAADSALTVGAVDYSDHLASFSSTGPRGGDAGLKPEITAPGVDILAARSQYGEGSGYYTTMSGTSMATPHVAGAAALLAAAHPDWTGQQLKEALVSSAKATPSYTPYEAGSGRVDALAAVHSTVFATASAFSGFHAWPQKPGETDVRKVTYTNTGDAPVTLDLAIDSAAPAGLFTLSDSRVTIPAHDTATVSLTADLDRLPADQAISGMITGTDAGGVVRARTLIGVAKEGQRQNLTIVAKDRLGQPLSGYAILIAEHTLTAVELDGSGTGTTRLPAGNYSGWLIADVQGANGPHSRGMALLGFSNVTLDQDRTVTLDGRKARQILARVPKQGTLVAPRLDVRRTWVGGGSFETSMLPDPSYDSIWALPTGKKVTDGEFEFGARFRLEQPALTVGTKTENFADPLVKRAAKPLPAGTRTLTAVDAGDGSAAELARRSVRGKAVVVRGSNPRGIQAQAEAAAAAGAQVLLVVNDGIGRMQPWDETTWSPESPAPLTVATLNADQGADLIAAIQRGEDKLKVTSHPTTDYLYDVVHHWSGAVPADPTWRVEQRDLGRVNVSFRNYRPGKAMEFRTDVWRGWAVSNPVTAPAQGERTDWVTADADWVEDAIIASETMQHSIDTLHYPAGKTAEVQWFGPIQRPRMGPMGYQPVRYLDGMYIPAPSWGDSGSGHVGQARGNFAVKDWMSLYQGDRQLDWGNNEWLPVTGLAPERLPYRLVLDNDRGSWANPYSRHTLTEWNFTSAASGAEAAEAVPLIQLDYGVDTDKAGRADRRATLTVTASHLPGTTAAIGKPSLEVSYDDGKTWQRADLTRSGAGWQTGLHAPKSAGFATLRVTARDSAGNDVSQTITRAFGLR